ncbi:MAG TPA: SRPBCC family protein [Acidobacteriota bacterium]|nr:SRPBCC family protein [Acidobacteriota bacterium]
MSQRAPDFVYPIYIAASPEEVWQGLMDRDMTEAYWQHYNVSEWKPGARWEHVRADGSGEVDIAGRVVEVDPPRKLVITWAYPQDIDDESKLSRVTIIIEEMGSDCRLTVTHSQLEPGSDMEHGVTLGWPAVLCNLKTLLETGQTLSDELWAKIVEAAASQ